ncbi:hypothetical protein DB347_01735 [Opitutaceae bacterium EW11]|nr:hypothetical protein DB347_01735 [Opitutaceae bacterium EW11]
MKSKLWLSLLAIGFLSPVAFAGTSVVHDTFADGNSRNQNLAQNSLNFFDGRGGASGNVNYPRTDSAGSVAFGMTPSATSSQAFWAYFSGNQTSPGTAWSNTAPVTLGVGDTLTVSLTFTITGLVGGGQDVRFGLLNSMGTRNTNNLTGGHNDATFADDVGYSLQFFPSGTGSPFVMGKRNLTTAASIGGLNNMFNNMAEFDALAGSGSTTRQTLSSGVPYTLTYSVYRQSDTATVLAATVSGGTLAAPYSWTATDSTAPVAAFDQLVYRIAGVSFATGVTFTDVNVQLSPALPVFTAQPTFSTGGTTQTVGIGAQVIMSASATGTGLAYQWNKDGTAVPGANAPSLTLTNVQPGDGGSYTLVVANGGGSITSDAIVLTVSNVPVDPPAVITVQPAGQTVSFGSPVTLSVTATGNALLYQWYKDGSPLQAQTSPTLTFDAVQPSDAGSYVVKITNDGGTVPSNAAKLTVLSTTLALGSVSPASGSPSLCADTPVSITFTAPPSLGSGLIKVFDASTNTAVDTIDVSLPKQNKSIGGLSNFNYYPVIVSGNRADIYFRNGVLGYNKTYYITVDSGVFRDAQGDFPGITDPAAWRFTTKPSAPDSSVTRVTVAADGTGDFATVQGAVDWVPAANSVPRTIFIRKGTYTEIVYFASKQALTFLGEDRFQTVIQYPNNNNLNSAGGAYHRMVFNADHANKTAIANLTIRNTTPLGGSQAEALILNGSSSSQAIVTGVELISYQDTLQINGQGYVSDSHLQGNVDFMWGQGPNFFYRCRLTANANGGYYTQIRNPNTTSTHGNVYLECVIDALPGVSGQYLSRIDPNAYPYSEVVYLNCTVGGNIVPAGWLLNNATSAPNIHFWEYASHDANGNPIDVSQRLADSKQLTIANDAATIANYSTPSYVLGGNWTPQLAPVIVAQPATQSVNLGDPASLTVGVVAVPSATYQWNRDGIPIPGATAATYFIASATGPDAGVYTVVVDNGVGTATSVAAALVVNGGPPVITLQPKSQSALAGATASFNVAVGGSGPFTYQWSKDGSPIPGASGPSLLLGSVQASDAGGYSVTVTNTGGAASGPVTSVVAMLTVVAPAGPVPTLPSIPAQHFNAADFGAVGDGATDNTAALKSAISAAQAGGGGTIELPPAPAAYLTGPITLSSNMNLQIDAGAVLQALPFSRYPNATKAPAHFITVASGSSNVAISGGGTIDGNGAAWWAAYDAGNISSRPRLVQINRTTNFLVTGVTLQNSPMFHLAFNNTHNVTLFGVTILAPESAPNSDGIDPAGSNYLIQNCTVSVGDDNIAVKASSVLNSNIVVADCAFGTGHGVSIGGQTNAGVDGMTVKNCTFDGTTTGLRLKADATQGGPVRNLTYSNITMTNVPYPILFYSYYNQVGTAGATSGSNRTTPAKVNTWNATPPNSLASSTIPTWQNITIENLTATGASGYSVIWGLPLADALIKNVTLKNVTISGGAGFEIYDATDIRFLGSGSVGPYVTCNALAITGQPQAASAKVGDTVSFAVSTAGASGTNNTAPSVRWAFNGSPLTDGTQPDGSVVSGSTTPTLTLANVRVTNAGSYTAAVSNLLDGYDVAASALAPNSLPVSATSEAASLAVAPVPASVALSDLSRIYTGSPLSPTVTTVPAGLAVSLTYDGSPAAPVNAASYAVEATITDPNYVGSAKDTFTIVQATPTIVWAAPAPIVYGTPLGSAQLNATASVSGSFSYSPAAGVVLDAGNAQSLKTVFAPSDSVNYTGASASTAIDVKPAPVAITLGNLSPVYDGTPKPASIATNPVGVSVKVTYDGAATAPVNAGSYAVVATSADPNYVGNAAGTLVIGKATAVLSIGGLSQFYNGTPRPVSINTSPGGLAVAITYNGAKSPVPSLPGTYAVAATVEEANYTGSATATLNILITALVRHAANVNGILDGSLQQLLGESVTLNSNAAVSGDLLLPGSPLVRINGKPVYAGIQDGAGGASPSNYSVTLNNGAVVRYLLRRVDPIAMPSVAAPPAPSGTRDIVINSAGQDAGNFATLRNLTLNGKAGMFAVPPGAYGSFTANGGSGFVLGVQGSTEPVVYNLQNLTLNGSSQLKVVGPVVLTVASGLNLNASAGESAHPDWLVLKIASGGLTLNGSSTELDAYVVAPAGAVMLNSGSLLRGCVTADSLTINGNGELATP